MKNYLKFPLPTTASWFRLPERVQALEDAPAPTPFELPYKVYTALLIQSGGGNTIGISSGPLTKGITYKIQNPGGDFSNVGAPNNDPETYFVAINNDAPLSYGGSALLYNTGAPVATVLENTIGNIWFSYTAEGAYGVNSNSLFPGGKVYGNISQQGGYNVGIELGGGGSDSDRQISTYDNGVLANNLLGVNAIEIRVYS